MKRNVLFITLILLSLMAAACGTIATPTPEAVEVEPVAEEAVDAEGEAVAAAPTETAIAPTEAPAADDQVAQFVGLFGDAARGEELFNVQYETEIGIWSCALCHNVDIPDVKIGPSLLGLPDRAGERVEGEVAERYIYNSILHPYDYFVEGYEGEDQQRMPPNYEELLVRNGNEQDVYDLIAYLMTLHEE